MSSSNTIAVFTVLNILLRMKNQLGLEAMMEYLDSYVKMIGQSNPGVQVAVNRAVGLLSMEKLYKDALSR
ncbi:MAG: hypothetical protein Q7S13_01435 [Candidatus Omnitrophota bacterium]|nr:hypothetical protein [Candidatus Omnitrophota bacterium]